MAEEKKAFDSVMDETRIFEPPVVLGRRAHVKNLAEYEEIYKRSIEDPEGFWAEKGGRVALYMPMIPELPIAMLACARIGVIHSVVFGGLSAESLRDRILDCEAKLLVTTDGGFRGGKLIGLKENVDIALRECPSVEACIVSKRSHIDVIMERGRDTWWEEEMGAEDITSNCEPEEMDAEDPLFILYTSGSTGKPKGVLHTTGGYLPYALQTTKWIFDIKDGDTYWCTADIGWVTGHSYIVYGPLALGATSVIFEGVPTYPNPDRFWEIVEKYTAIPRDLGIPTSPSSRGCTSRETGPEGMRMVTSG